MGQAGSSIASNQQLQDVNDHHDSNNNAGTTSATSTSSPHRVVNDSGYAVLSPSDCDKTSRFDVNAVDAQANGRLPTSEASTSSGLGHRIHSSKTSASASLISDVAINTSTTEDHQESARQSVHEQNPNMCQSGGVHHIHDSTRPTSRYSKTSDTSAAVSSGSQADRNDHTPNNTSSPPPPSRRKSFMDRLRDSRRRSAQRLGFSRRTSSPHDLPKEAEPACTPSTEIRDGMQVDEQETSGASAGISYSSFRHDQTSDTVPELQRMTQPLDPAPDNDPMYEERQRARRLVEATLAQVQSNLERSRLIPSPAPESLSSRHSHVSDSHPFPSISEQTAPAMFLSDNRLVDGNNTQDTSPFAVGVGDMPVDQNVSTMNAASLTTSSLHSGADQRTYAALPRRSSSRSPTPPVLSSQRHDTASVPLLPSESTVDPSSTSHDSQSIPSSVLPPDLSNNDGSTIPMADGLNLPRRILVQGIVASAPPRSSRISRSTTPSNPQRTGRAQSGSSDLHTSTQAAQPANAWAELPDADALNDVPIPGDRDDRSRETSQVDNSRWLDSLDAALAGAPEITSEASNPQQMEAEDSPDGLVALREQANLIGRLLSVAAAATAATLLPGSIIVNGQPVTGFGDAPVGHVQGSGIPVPSTFGDSAMQREEASGTPSTVTRSRSDSFGTLRNPLGPRTLSQSTYGSPEPRPSRSTTASSSSLQDTLRSALAAAFRTAAPSSDTTQVTDADVSSTTSADNVGLPGIDPAGPTSTTSADTHSLDDMATDGPTYTGTHEPFSSGAALAIPVTALQTNSPYVTGTNHALGSFERFLSDLQTDVSQAILSSRPTSENTTQSPLPQTTDQVDGLDQLRPLLDDVEQASDGQSDSVTANPETVPTTTSATGGEQQSAFSFFRSYRFPARATAEQTTSAVATDPARVIDTPTVPTNAQELPPAETFIPSSAPNIEIDTSQSHAPDVQSVETPTTNSVQVQDPAPTIPTATVPALATASTTASSASHTLPSTDSLQTPVASTGIRPPSRNRIVPMLLVGVRSAQIGPFSQTSSHGSQAGDSNALEGLDTSGGMPTDVPTDSAASLSDSATAQSRSTSSTTGGHRGYILWILGGLYPANHPVVIAPAILGDDAMSYEDLLRLAEVLGNVKPSTVTQEEIQKSDLRVVKSEALTELHEKSEIRTITLDRCLICLEDYEPDEDVRVLQCRHCFHQACVDKWLSIGANTCPACRGVGVIKEEPRDTSFANSSITDVASGLPN